MASESAIDSLGNNFPKLALLLSKAIFIHSKFQFRIFKVQHCLLGIKFDMVINVVQFFYPSPVCAIGN